MKAITIRQPWASAVALGWKPVENRTWQTNHRGPLAIHAASGVGTKAEYDWALALVAELAGQPAETVLALTQVRGAIVAVADLTEVCEEARKWAGSASPHGCECGPWAFNQAHHFQLANARRLTSPIPVKGALNLWRVPAAVVDLINDQASGERAA